MREKELKAGSTYLLRQRSRGRGKFKFLMYLGRLPVKWKSSDNGLTHVFERSEFTVPALPALKGTHLEELAGTVGEILHGRKDASGIRHVFVPAVSSDSAGNPRFDTESGMSPERTRAFFRLQPFSVSDALDLARKNNAERIASAIKHHSGGGYKGLLAKTPAHLDETMGVHPFFCLLYTSPSPRDATLSRMPSSA